MSAWKRLAAAASGGRGMLGPLQLVGVPGTLWVQEIMPMSALCIIGLSSPGIHSREIGVPAPLIPAPRFNPKLGDVKGVSRLLSPVVA